jgi:hypothetical protein
LLFLVRRLHAIALPPGASLSYLGGESLIVNEEGCQMNDAEGTVMNAPIEPGRKAPHPDEPHVRAVGSPLPMGGSPLQAPVPADAPFLSAAPPPGRALVNTASITDQQSGVQRAMGMLRTAMPMVQKLLPLLDGNVVSAIANLLNPHPQAHAPSPPVDLVPLEDSIGDLQLQHRELRDQVIEQNSTLKRVEDQLEMVREATDRNTLEQQELIEDLKAVGSKVTMFALFALGLLAVSVLVNVILYLHLKRVLP